MKRKILFIILFIFCITSFSSAYSKENAIKCSNGIFIGKKAKNTDVIAFKGIPFAEKPVGKLRWKPPVPAADSNKKHFAYKYNTIALQPDPDFRKSEDCLRLNIWTADLEMKNKPVMVYFHGGAYGWEGSIMDLYNGEYLANEYRDIILVTIDYRVNLMGFIDFSNVPGGENFREAPYLGILDCLMGLKWVNQNIEAFGGDPDNITIFGESAGGGIVSIMMVLDEAQGLFQKVIAESGTLNLTATKEKFNALGQAEAFMDAAGAENMDDLMDLSSRKILKTMEMPTSRIGTEGLAGVAFLNNFPLRGNESIIPADPYVTLRKGMSKDIDLMIGTNADEFRYWIDEMLGDTVEENIARYDAFIRDKAQLKDKDIQDRYFASLDIPEDKYSARYKDIWTNTELANEIWFRMPSIKTAEAHIEAAGTGKTYMYSFNKKCDHYDWWGAAHASEVLYVFNNLSNHEYGSIDRELAKKVSSAWVNFARTGDPSTEYAQWTEYDLKNRDTMVIDDDNSMKMISDYKGEQRKILDEMY